MKTACDDPQCPLVDAPLLSGKRLFFAVGRYLFEAACNLPEARAKHSLLYRLRFYGRQHAKEAWKHKKERSQNGYKQRGQL